MGLQVVTELFQNTYELSLEGYYKTMEDLIAYKAGYSTLQSTESWENAVETGGEGESYGAEFFFKRKKEILQDGLDTPFLGPIEDLII